MKPIVLTILGMVLMACKKDVIKADYKDISTRIYYLKSNIDMLNPKNLEAFKLEDISFEFQKSEGHAFPWVSIETSQPQIIVDSLDNYFLLLHPSGDKGVVPKPTAWVKVYWPNGIVDKFTFGIGNPYENVEVASYIELNDELVWPLTDEDKKGQRIVKIER